MDDLMALAKAWVSKRSLADAFGCHQGAEAAADRAEAAFTAAITALVERAEKAEGENKRLFGLMEALYDSDNDVRRGWADRRIRARANILREIQARAQPSREE